MKLQRLGRLIQEYWKRLRMTAKDEDLSYRFLALFLAIVLWFFAGGQTRFFADESRITLQPEVIGLPDNYLVLDQPQEVNIVLRGANVLLVRAKTDVSAVVNLSNVIEGEGYYPVDISLPKGLELVSVTPQQVSLVAERIGEKTFPVQVGLLGLPVEYGIQSYTPRPQTALVTGPISYLDQVTDVVTYITLSNQMPRMEGSFKAHAIDVNGHEVRRVSVVPEFIHVTLTPVIQLIEKQLPVIPQFTGNLAPEYELSSASIMPESLTVRIDENSAEEIRQLITDPITLTGLTPGEYTMDVSVILPGSVEAVDDPVVTVNLEVIEVDSIQPEQPLDPPPMDDDNEEEDLGDGEIVWD